MTIVVMELIPLGCVSLYLRIEFGWPFDDVSHALHDSDNLGRLDIEIIL